MKAVLLLPLAGLAACSAPQVWQTGQAWQQNQCQRVVDADERSRCLKDASGSYEDYRREAERVK